ncbi:MAG: hypothetical protein JWO56_416 [Acidobacteria bacterium]|nr:hypothetical protein [Acidobacteriota bacterium]
MSLIFRALAFFRYRFDSDEPQHLHVAWGWTAGLVQYRDYFDNHAPLFHLLTAPILRLVGEREDAMLFMRIPMLPLWLLVVAATWIVARRLYSIRVALWATLVLAVMPAFFLKSIEYRTDNLWMALWALILIVLTLRPVTPLRIFLVAFLLGIALCVSLKTILFVITLLLAGAITVAMTGAPRPSALRFVPAALGGFVIAPAAVIAWFVRLKAWPSLVYCVFTFNELLTKTRNPWPGRIVYPFAMALALFIAWRLRGRVVDDVTRWRFFYGVAMAVFLITLGCFWLLISPRDYMPILPLAAIFFAARVTRARHATLIFAATALLCFGYILKYTERFRDKTTEHYTMIRQVLGLSRPGEPLMDIKGETIFRPRPFYYIFELITRAQMEHGLIADTIPESLVAKRCHVAQADGKFLPPRGRAFMLANYLDVGRLRASGQWIADDGSFTIAVPGDYLILADTGGAGSEATGMLDGTPYGSARSLGAGAHRFEAAAPGARLAVFWAPAYARGYSPFHLRDREF